MPIAFATPWVLAALLVLPVVWWLLRVTPPAPRIIRFPAIRLLRDLVAREETPARTPPWLLILRLVLATLVILALARPLLNPRALLPGRGPVLLAVDNGWAAARDWPARQRLMDDVLNQAERQGRDVLVLATAPSPAGEPPTITAPLRPVDARRLVQSLEPLPWPTDRTAALAAVRDLKVVSGTAHAVWLSDGLGGADALALAERLQRLGSAEVVIDTPDRLVRLALPPAVDGAEMTARVVRADATVPDIATVRLTAGDGRLLGRETIEFPAGQRLGEARFDLPIELRNEATRLQIENEATAGAAVLLDARWRRRPVGMVSGRPEGENQPLLSELYYLERALNPVSEVRRGTAADLLQRDLAVLILADVGALTGGEAETIGAWVERGGVLLRFAGPRLAQHADTLVPVRLRLGDRTLGGTMSWSEPAHLAPFEAHSPFFGLTLPADITVERQVLAEPSLDTPDNTWARLADGTPLVTGAKRGQGWVVLVHTTANTDWSNLALSGLFVEMLRRTAALSGGVAGSTTQAGTLEPLEVLDGFGRLVRPPATAFPLAAAAFATQAVGPRHPPGFYGTTEARRALNLSASVTDISALRALPRGVGRSGYAQRGEVELRPWLLAAALALGIVDLIIALALRGLLPGRRRSRTAPSAAPST